MTETQTPKDWEYVERLMTLYSAPIDTTNGPVSAVEVGWRFSLSEYGRYMMDQQPYRFSHHFGYDRQQMEEDLGTDVLPVHHQVGNSQYVTWILEAEQQATGKLPIADEEVGLAVFTSLVHDMGECCHPEIAEAVGEVVGDIPAGEKTDHNREVESAVRKFLYGKLFSDIDPAVMARVEGLITHREESAVHDVVEAAHSLQAFITGLMAGKMAVFWDREIAEAKALNQPLPRSEIEVAQLHNLHEAVVKRMAPYIETFMKQFVYVDKIARLFPGALTLVD